MKIKVFILIVCFLSFACVAVMAGDLYDNGNGTVTDNNTGLMWQQDDAPLLMDWEFAIFYCDELSLGGYSNWRLPNIKELVSLTDDTLYNPAIDTNFFPNIVLDEYGDAYYWSSTTRPTGGPRALTVNFGDGESHSSNKENSLRGRCVRGF